jgi:hypothetical protein
MAQFSDLSSRPSFVVESLFEYRNLGDKGQRRNNYFIAFKTASTSDRLLSQTTRTPSTAGISLFPRAIERRSHEYNFAGFRIHRVRTGTGFKQKAAADHVVVIGEPNRARLDLVIHDPTINEARTPPKRAI